MNDAKKLLEAVEKRFGRNAATKKIQRNLLKQQYENFTAPSSEMLDQTFDRIQKLSAITAIRGDILLGSAELQEIKTTSTKKTHEGVCMWKHLLPQLWCHVMVLLDMIGVTTQKKDQIMHSWLSHLQVLTQRLQDMFKIVDNYKKGLGYENYNAVSPPYTEKFMPLTPNLSFTGLDEFVNKPVVEKCKAKSSEEETKVVRKNDDAPIIKE
nr:xylulose kinase-1 [Tanacetum cinerariifolium]